MREETDIIIAIHGLLPLLEETDGRSRNQAEREMRKLIQAIYYDKSRLLKIVSPWNALP